MPAIITLTLPIKQYMRYVLSIKKRPVLILVLAICSVSNCFAQQRVAKGFIKAGNFQVYYERAGKGESIMLLHAGLQDHTMWKKQVESLSVQYDVITPDLPYHGKTIGADTSLLVEELLTILLDSLHINKVSIAGLSMGANVAQDFIIAHPEKVNKAFLISAGINGYDKKFAIDSVSMDWYRHFSQALQQKDTIAAAKEFTKAWAEGIYRKGDSLQAPVSKYVYNTTLSNLRLHKMEGWPLLQSHPPAIDRLSSISVPVLIINGNKDLPYIITACKYLEKHIPGSHRIVFKDVAHMLNIEKPLELNRLIINFLRK